MTRPWCSARGPVRCFWEVTLPTIWPSLLGAFLISFILAFNNLEISFYNLGAIPTLPSVAWGSLRFGLGPELFALAALANVFVFAVFAVMYGLMRTGLVKFGYRGQLSRPGSASAQFDVRLRQSRRQRAAAGSCVAEQAGRCRRAGRPDLGCRRPNLV